MTRKADKRARGEAKAKQEAADRLASGLAAQKADRERRKLQAQGAKAEGGRINKRHNEILANYGVIFGPQGKTRTELLNKGINPSTGEVFTDEEMAEMEKKANTPDRRHLFNRIKAGRAGTLNEQPPLGDSSDYLEPVPDLFGSMTVGEFRDTMDKMTEAWLSSMRDEAQKDTPFKKFIQEKKTAPRFMETQSALRMFTRPED